MARGGGMLRIAHSGRAAPTRRRDRAGAGGGGGGGGGGRPRGLGGGGGPPRPTVAYRAVQGDLLPPARRSRPRPKRAPDNTMVSDALSTRPVRTSHTMVSFGVQGPTEPSLQRRTEPNGGGGGGGGVEGAREGRGTNPRVGEAPGARQGRADSDPGRTGRDGERCGGRGRDRDACGQDAPGAWLCREGRDCAARGRDWTMRGRDCTATGR